VSETELASRPAAPSVWHMYRAMVGVGIVCGLLIVSAFQVTRPIIERNKAEALQKAIFHVLPSASTSATYRLDESDGFLVLEGKEAGAELVHAGYDDKHELVGLAVEALGMGYLDVIAVIYCYCLAEDAFVGIQFLESK
jgi:electron transport complex protein RnfG